MNDVVSALHANWNYPTSIRAGAGRVNELADACQSLGIGAPLLITDTGLAVYPYDTRRLLFTWERFQNVFFSYLLYFPKTKSRHLFNHKSVSMIDTSEVIKDNNTKDNISCYINCISKNLKFYG